MASNTYHEPLTALSSTTCDMHRALVSLMEELEAIDWYRQRADACSDPELKGVLLHNKNEETEHAAMLMEWLRRHDDHFSQMMRKYLFTDESIVGLEHRADTDNPSASITDTLGVDSTKEK